MGTSDSQNDRTGGRDQEFGDGENPEGDMGEGPAAVPDDLMAAFAAAIREDPELVEKLRRALDAQGPAESDTVDGLGPSEESDGSDEFYMVGRSEKMRAVFQNLRRYAASDAPVLVTGESGTGKELAARAIHMRSARAAAPFVAINCAALPPSLIASELFGHERGAFTGAFARKIGRLEQAQGGTVFLDEIGDLPLDLQGHLLRFLQEKTIERVGGHQPIVVDARVVAATNVDLPRAIQSGRLREDLFYRLNVLSLTMPALRERGDDLLLLARHLLKKFRHEMRVTVEDFHPSAVAAITTHHWPGNVRELIACVRRGAVLAEGRYVMAEDLKIHPSEPTTSPGQTQPRAIDAERLREALVRNRFNVSRASKDLGISRVTFYRLLKRFGIVIGR